MAAIPNTFAGNVFKLVSGNIFAQVLGIMLAPITARLFSPGAFGVAGVFSSIVAVVSLLTCLRYEFAIMSPKSDAEAANLFGLCLCLVLLTSFVASIILLAAGGSIAKVLKVPELGKYLWLMPVSILFSGLFLAFNGWNSRIKQFGRLSLAQVFSSLTAQATKLTAGFAGYVSAGTLIGTSTLGTIVSTSLLGGRIWHDDGRFLKRSIRWPMMIEGGKRYRDWPLFSVWSILFNTVSQQSPVWMLAFFFTPEIVGFYTLGKTVLGIPMILAGGAITQVFYQKASEVYNISGDLPGLLEGVFKRLVSLSILPIFIITMIGRDVFVVVFGARWAEAGIYIQILGLWFFFQFITAPVTYLFAVLEKQRLSLLFSIILFVTRVGSLIFGGVTGEIRLTLLLLAGTGILHYGILSLYLSSSVGLAPARIVYQVLSSVVHTLPVLLVMGFSKWFLGIGSIGIMVIGVFCMAGYYSILLIFDKELSRSVFLLLHRMGLMRRRVA